MTLMHIKLSQEQNFAFKNNFLKAKFYYCDIKIDSQRITDLIHLSINVQLHINDQLKNKNTH